ncbi:PIN domain-containing protein [Nocardia amamiensis]|uniref:PIN domain-containing protein n=1 Tax=Nocardia amamiensis TaxID=404578 RepID=UPI0008323419|nr:PIN domain-containing protein [Nocardia amamiensis]
MTVLVVDTSAILAAFDESYPEHTDIARILTSHNDLLVVSPLIAAEADYMLAARLGTRAARDFARDIATGAYELAEWTSEDHGEALELTRRFGNLKDYIGIADASNVILADRYRTTTIVTLDQRHFRRLVPLWGAAAFTLLPYDTV